MNIIKLEPSDIITMKKPHPCSCYDFQILRVGSDIRMKCIKCNRDITISRIKLEPSIKLINGVNKSTSNNHEGSKT